MTYSNMLMVRYQLSNAVTIDYDVAQFARYLDEVSNRPENIRIMLEQALQYYRGPYLQEMKREWVIRRRRDFSASYADAVKMLEEMT